MRSVLKLVWANIIHHKGSFKGIIFLMMILTFSFAGTVSNNDDLNAALDRCFSENEFGDLLIEISDELFTDDMRSYLESNEHIEKITYEKGLRLLSMTRAAGSDIDTPIYLYAYDSGIRVFNEKADGYIESIAPQTGEIYLPYKMKSLPGIEIGGTIELCAKGSYSESFTIKGFIEDPIYGSVIISDANCYISTDEFDRLASEKTDSITDERKDIIRQTDIHIHISDGTAPAALKKQISRESDIIDYSFFSATKEHIRNYTELVSKIGTRGVYAYTALMIVIVLIVMHNSISSSIDMEYTSLGILRSQGFTVRQIRLVYIIQYIAALVIGAVLGLIAAIPICHVLIGMWMNITGILTSRAVSFVKCGVLCVCIILISLVFVAAATAKISKISPVRAISGGAEDVYFDSRLNIGIKRPLPVFLALRQITSHIGGYIGMTVIVTLMVFFVMTLFSLISGFDPDMIIPDIGSDITVNTSAVNFDEVPDIEDTIRGYDPDAEIKISSSEFMTVDDEQYRVQMLTDEKATVGRLPEYDNEILVTKTFAEQNGTGIGDTIELGYRGEKHGFIITGYYSNMMNLGMVLTVPKSGIEKMGIDSISGMEITLSDTSKRDTLINALNDKYHDDLEASETPESAAFDSMKDLMSILMDSLSYTMYAITAVFAIVVVNMVCRREFIRERSDIGIYKSQGFTVSALRSGFAMRFAITSFTGAVVGDMLSAAASKPLIMAMLNLIGIDDFTISLNVFPFLVPAAAAVLFYLSAYAASGRIRTVEVRELITE